MEWKQLRDGTGGEQLHDLAIAGLGAGAGCIGVVAASIEAPLLGSRITDTVAGLSGRDEDDKGDKEKLGKDGREAHIESVSLLSVMVELMEISDLCACFYIRSRTHSVTDEHPAPSGMIEHSRARPSFPGESHPCPFKRTNGEIHIISK